MLVDINLLPQNDKKSKNVYILLGVAALIFLASIIAFLFILHNKKQDLSAVEKQISQTTAILEAERNKLADFESSSSFNELETVIKWANNQPYNLVYALQEITKLLPERGFIVEFEIDEQNDMNQLVQFDTKREAAYYLNSLLTLEWIDEAVISEAKTTDILEKENENTEDENILPRYYAQYELRINVSALRTAYEESKDKASKIKNSERSSHKTPEEEGGTSP